MAILLPRFPPRILPPPPPPPMPTADDVERQLQQQARLKGIGRVLRRLGLMRLEDTEDVGLTNFKTRMVSAPQDILGGLRRLGRTPDSESFIRSLKPEIDEDGLNTILGELRQVQPAPVSPVSARVTEFRPFPGVVLGAPPESPQPPETPLRPSDVKAFPALEGAPPFPAAFAPSPVSERVTPTQPFKDLKPADLPSESKLWLDTRARQKAIDAGENFYYSTIRGGEEVSVVNFPLTRPVPTFTFPSLTGGEPQRIVKATGQPYKGETETIDPDTGRFPSDEPTPWFDPDETKLSNIRHEEMLRVLRESGGLGEIIASPVVQTISFVAGIAAIGLSGGVAIKDATAWRRLPEYKELVRLAKEFKVSRSSPDFKKAERALRDALTYFRTGATEASQEIMSRYYQEWARFFERMAAARTGATSGTGAAEREAATRAAQVLRQPLIPRGTQTRAMIMGGTTKEPIPPSILRVAAKIAGRVQLTPEEEQFRFNNREAIEVALRANAPVPEAVPAVEEERQVRIKYFLAQEGKWLDTAFKMGEEGKDDSLAFTRAKEFGLKALELQRQPTIPKAEAAPEVAIQFENVTSEVQTLHQTWLKELPTNIKIDIERIRVSPEAFVGRLAEEPAFYSPMDKRVTFRSIEDASNKEKFLHEISHNVARTLTNEQLIGFTEEVKKLPPRQFVEAPTLPAHFREVFEDMFPLYLTDNPKLAKDAPSVFAYFQRQFPIAAIPKAEAGMPEVSPVTPDNPYMGMEMNLVRQAAQYGVKLAKEALAVREAVTPEVTPIPEVTKATSEKMRQQIDDLRKQLKTVPRGQPAKKILNQINKLEGQLAQIKRNELLAGKTEADFEIKQIRPSPLGGKLWSVIDKTTNEEISAASTRKLAQESLTKILKRVKGLEQQPTIPKAEAAPEVIKLPEGWRMEIGETRTKEGITSESEVDWRRKVIVFRDKESLANPKIINHEVAHVQIEELPDSVKSKLLDSYVKVAGISDWEVKNQFHREQIAIDYGQYLTDASQLKPEVKAFFDKKLPKTAIPKAEAGMPEVSPVTPEVTALARRPNAGIGREPPVRPMSETERFLRQEAEVARFVRELPIGRTFKYFDESTFKIQEGKILGVTESKEGETLIRIKPLVGKEFTVSPEYLAETYGLSIEEQVAKLIERTRQSIKVARGEGIYKDYADKMLQTKYEAELTKLQAIPKAEAVRPEIVTPEVTGRETVAYGPDPTKSYQMRYRLVELDDLIPSHTDAFVPNPKYPKELQPRIRERGTARLAVTKMAKDLVPEVLIKDDNTLDRGPMIIGNDNVVESGNGRVMALRQAQQSYPERWQAYQQALQEALPQFGISQTKSSQMRNPVLVRERISDVDRVQFASEANQPAVAVFSPLENALQDARRIRFDTLIIPEETQSLDVTLRMTGNRPFVTGFLEALPANERASLLDSAGDLNLLGMQRIKAAMFAATYPGESGRRLTQIFFESREPIIRNIEEGMLASLPKVARAEELVRVGNRGADLSIGEDLAKSLDMLAVLRQRKLSVAQYLAQRQMFERELTPFQERLLQHAETIARSPRKVREFLGDYADAVIASPPPQQASMLAGGRLTKEDLFNATVRRQEEGPLFAQPEGEIAAIPPTLAREPGLVAQAPGISKPQAVTLPVPAVAEEPAPQPAPQPAQAVPELAVEEAMAITPEQETARLREQLKAKLATEPLPSKPVAPKTPVERREEIRTLLAEPAKNLPKGITKIALRKELVGINKSLIPQEKKLRQQIMASVKSKSLPQSQYRDIFKDTGGSRHLSDINLTELQKVLAVVEKTRPKKIGGRTVVTEKTEKVIQALKTELVKQGKLSENAYKQIMKYLRLKTDKFNNPQSFISESQAKELIRQMNYEVEVGLIEKDNKIAAALENNPKLKDAIGKIRASLNVSLSKANAKKVGVSPFWDMHLYLEKLQERTGERFADVWEEAIRIMYRNEALLAEMDNKLFLEVGEDFAKIASSDVALQRINDAIASKRRFEDSAVEEPADITDAEKRMAAHIEQELFGLQDKVRQTRFYTSYRENKGDIAAIARDIPNAPKADIKQAAEIYESQGREALNKYLDTKTWGVIRSGYEPHNAINYRLRITPSKEAAVGKSHLRSREETTARQDRNILDRRRSYLRQAMNWDLEAYLRKLDQMMVDASPGLKNPAQVKDIVEQAMRELKGFHPTDVMTKTIQRASSYAFSTLALSPAMTLRNSLQNLFLHPHREAFVHLFDTRLDDMGKEYFRTFVNAQSSIVMDLLMQEGMGTTRLEQLVRRLTYYGWAETNINRSPGFLASYGKALRALNQYKVDGNLSRFIKSSGIEELTPLEQKQVLGMMAQETVDFGEEGLEAVPGGQAAIYEIARRIVQQTHFNYKRTERAPIEMGAQGRTWGSLMTFPRNIGQRMYQDAIRVKNGSPRQKALAARRVIAILVFAYVSDWLYRKVADKDQSEYNPLTIIAGWGLGGLAAGAGEVVGDVIRNAVEVVSGDEGAINRLITAIPRAGDMFVPFYKATMDLLETLTDTIYLDRRMLREVRQILDENYKLKSDYYERERGWIQKFQHAIFGGGNKEQVIEIPGRIGDITEPLKAAQKAIPEALANLGGKDQFGLDRALREATADEASPAKIAGIKAKDWTYDITSVRRDIGDAIRGLRDKSIAQLPPIAVAYSEFSEQQDAYGDLSAKEQEQYVKDNPDYIINRLFWGDNNLITIPDLKTAEALEAMAEKYDIALDMIPAFQLTDKGKERIPSDRTLWQAYFGYYDLPSGSYLNFTQEQVDAGELPEKYRKEWETYHKYTTESARKAFRKARAHKEITRGDWRDNFRREHLGLDEWFQEHKDLKPLSEKARARANIRAQAARPFFGGFRPVSGRRRLPLPKFPKPKFGTEIGAPSVR